jgi:predicted lipoprotein with Yx(FWY)xxD motif
MLPTRTSLFATVAAAAIAGAGAGAADGSGPAATAAKAPTVRLVSTGIGKILVTNRNFTLYLFTHDKRGKDTCIAISMCQGAWPPYTTKSKPTAGPGVKKSLLGTIKIGHGKLQVTYAGHPLYRYAFDIGPKDTSYVGAIQFAGTWEAVKASGKGVK